jgi:flagellar hook-associated protein 2
LAQAQTQVLKTSFDSRSATIPSGTITINQAGQEKTFAINATNNTLESFQASFNAANLGVSAAIIRDGNEFKLMFSSQNSGADGAFSLSASGSAEIESLLGVNNDLTKFDITSSAQNAQIKVNGVLVNSATNRFDDVLDGVTFTAKQAQPGLVQQVSIERDTSQVVDAVKDFVLVYNQLQDILKDVTSTRELTEEEKEDPFFEFTGALAGNPVLRAIQTQIRDAITTPLSGQQPPFNTLASIGISFNRDGTLELDETELTSAIDNNFMSLAGVFAKGGQSDNSLIQVLSTNDRTQEGDYDVFVTSVAERAVLAGLPMTLDGNGDLVLGAGAQFDLVFNGSEAVTLAFAEGSYSPQAFASLLQSAINNEPTLQTLPGRIEVAFDSDTSSLQLSSSQFGRNSEITLSNISGFENTGLTETTTRGADAQGRLEMDGRSLDLGAFADANDGRLIKISNFAVNAVGQPAAARGLEFRILGGVADASTPLGRISVSEGFASRVFEQVKNLVSDSGQLGSRLETLQNKSVQFEEQRSRLDARFEAAEARYRLQFANLQSILSQFERTGDFLSMTFNRNN